VKGKSPSSDSIVNHLPIGVLVDQIILDAFLDRGFGCWIWTRAETVVKPTDDHPTHLQLSADGLDGESMRYHTMEIVELVVK
jgi:hypothetical protein